MQADFARALSCVLVYEGGKVDDPRDPGGRTNRGITQTTYNVYLRSQGRKGDADVYTITDAEVSDIYLNNYWAVVAGDTLPAGLDLVVFDGAVNSGPGQSGKWLQYALGGSYQGPIDGLVGNRTLQAIEAYVQGHDAIEELINDYCERRLATLQHLTTWKIYGNGWHARIANGMKIADAWATASPPPAIADVSAIGGHKRASVSDIKVSPMTTAATHATTIASTAGAVAANASANLAPVQAALPHVEWLGYALGALAAVGAVSTFVVKSINDVRAEAEKGSATAAVNIDADENCVKVIPSPAPAKAA